MFLPNQHCNHPEMAPKNLCTFSGHDAAFESFVIQMPQVAFGTGSGTRSRPNLPRLLLMRCSWRFLYMEGDRHDDYMSRMRDVGSFFVGLEDSSW